MVLRFVGVDTSNEQDYTSILCCERITDGSEIELIPVRLAKGQFAKLRFDEFEEIK